MRTWLEAHPHGTITFHWVPGHAGIDFNEHVDGDARTAADTMAPSPFTSFAFRRQGIRQRGLSKWSELSQDRSHRGHDFLQIRARNYFMMNS